MVKTEWADGRVLIHWTATTETSVWDEEGRDKGGGGDFLFFLLSEWVSPCEHSGGLKEQLLLEGAAPAGRHSSWGDHCPTDVPESNWIVYACDG